MKDTLKRRVKAFSRKNWFFYKLVTFARGFFGRMGGGAKMSIRGCVRLHKNVQGKNNSIACGEGCLIDHLGIRIMGDNNIINIGKNCTIQKGCDFWIIGNNCTIIIGDDTRLGTNCAIEVQEDNQSIIIGEDNLWSHNIRLRNNDSHYIYNAETGKRTNLPKPITIGNHVWIAAYTTILKGVNIGDGSVIGTHALVTKSIPNNVVAGGIPAKILQENIEWSDSPRMVTDNKSKNEY